MAKKEAKSNGEMVIEHGIPVPTPGGRDGIYCKVLRKMKVGDSVVLPLTTNRANQAAAYAFGGSGKSACRTVENGTRVWRIK